MTGRRWAASLLCLSALVSACDTGVAEGEGSAEIPYVTYRWGEGRSVAPVGLFVDVSVSEFQSCGVRVDGGLVCWGDDLGVLPSGLFEQVAVSDGGGCALRRDGTVACWLGGGGYQTVLLEGPFVGELLDLQAASGFSAGALGCGVRVEGGLVCWGEDVQFPSGMPDGRFARMVGTGYYGEWCALGADGKVACWGHVHKQPPSASVPEGLRFSDAWLGRGYGCGIELGGATVCWETGSLEPVDPAALVHRVWASNRRAHPGALPLPDAGLARFARGSAGCAIDTDGELRGHCGHEPYHDSTSHRDHEPDTFVGPPSGPFTAVALSVGHGCGLRADGTLACWGYPYGTETTW